MATGTTIRRAWAVGVVLVVGVGALPALASPARADTDPVQVDELAVQVQDPSQGLTTGGPAVDPASDDTVVADRSVSSDRVATEVVDTGDYQTVGVTWPVSQPGENLDVQVRTRTDGTWSGWTPMPASDAAPDAGTADAKHEAETRDGTDSLWIGDADAVQLSVDQSAAAEVSDVRLAVIGSDPAPAAAPTPTGTPAAYAPAPGGAVAATPALYTPASGAMTAETVASAPAVVTRAQWGAVAPSCAMGTAPLVGAVLHHTAGSNDYTTTAQAMQQIRNDQRYHMQSRGWCDLGYNFVVDKWGNVYEGRAGSLTSSVIGVHAGGFNTGTVGIAMLGTYSTVTPSSATTRAVAQIVAWKLRPYGLDPAGSMSYYTGAGENSRYKNQWVSLPRVFGHRDVAYTDCPGGRGYATLPTIRQLAHGDAGPMFVSPALSRTSMPIGGSVTLSGPTISNIYWTLTVTDDRTGTVMFTSIGLATEAWGGLAAGWDGGGPAGPVGPGPYRLTVTGTDVDTGQAAPPWSGVVQVTGSQNPPTVAAVPLAANLGYDPATPARLLDTRTTGQSLGPASRVDLKVAGVAGVPADAKAVALNVTAVYASAVTYVRAWPAGSAEPASSVLNAAPGATSAAATVVGVGGEGKVSLRNNAGSVHLVVDVTGYYASGGSTLFTPLARAERLVDTRTDGGLVPGATRRVQVAGVDGVPSDATAVMVNVTSAAARGDGFVSVVPAGGNVRATSTVNHRAGTDVANRATVPLSGGKIDVYLEGAQAGVVVDVVGWYGPSGTLRLTPVQPQRVVDTRASGGGGPVGARQTRTLAVRDAITTSGTPVAALATLTATQQSAPTTYLTVAAAGSPLPPTSDLNTGAGRDQAALVLLVWDGSGRSVVYNNAGSTQVVVDVNAVFR